MCCSYTPERRAIGWSVSNLEGATTLKDVILPPPEPLTGNSTLVGSRGVREPLSSPCWNVAWLVLGRSCVDNYSCSKFLSSVSGHVIHRRHCWAMDISNLWLLKSFCPSLPQRSLSLRCGMVRDDTDALLVVKHPH